MQKKAYLMNPSQLSSNVMMTNNFSPHLGIPSLQHLNYGMQEQVPRHEQQYHVVQRINLESKIRDMNRRLCFFHIANIPEHEKTSWWNGFTFEFFDDQARIQLHLYDENLPPQKYVFGRTTIPRFFKALFENGVREMYIIPKVPCREGISNNYPLIFLDCDSAVLYTKQEKPAMIDVQTEIRFLIEFSLDSIYGYRIRNWILELKHCCYFSWKDQNQKNNNRILDKLKLGFAHLGLNQHALNTIKLANILEPMQILFYVHKTQGIHPKTCIAHALMQYRLKLQQNQRIQEQRMAQQRIGPHNHGVLPSLMMMESRSEESTLVQKKSRKRSRKNVLAEIGETGSTDLPESLNKKKCSRNDSSAENSPINNNLLITTTSSDSEKTQALSNGLEVPQEQKTMGENYISENERKMLRTEHSPVNINESLQLHQQILNKPLMQQNFHSMINQ
uniref:LIM domain-binding protein 2 (inferred by orthology to a human protein) n=1 Tax=Strongyloides venezuelensis TaxID=75913 RepID=A0A0K0FE60_STRVS